MNLLQKESIDILFVKRKKDVRENVATSLMTLEKIVRKQNEVSGMADGLYSIFTGNFVQVEDLKEDESNDEVENRAAPEASPPTIFPNPATDVINISFKESSKIDVSIRDYYGDIVLTAQSEGLNLSINVSNLKEGLYYLEIVQNETNHFIEKIFIQQK